MALWIALFVGPLAGYLLGSFPTGYLAGRLFQGIDIREHGSRSTGATNVLRTAGKGPALLVILTDLAKGAASVVFARWLCAWLWGLHGFGAGAPDAAAATPWIVCLAGLAAVLGHARSIWLRFTGGKSAAAGLGILLAMSWPVGLGAALAVAVVLALSRIMSLASILGALAAVALVLLLDQPLACRLLVLAGAAYDRPAPRQHRAAPGRQGTAHRTDGELVVEPQQVVLGETEATDGCLRLYPTVWPMPVVAM